MTIPQRQIRAALKRYDLTHDNDERRLIYCFDTPEPALLKAGIIVLRAG